MTSVLAKKKTLATSQVSLISLLGSSQNKKFLSWHDEKLPASAKRQATHIRKNLRALQFLCRMQLKIQYTPVQSIPHVHVPEDPREFYTHEASGCHQEGGESPSVLARGLYTEYTLFKAKIV